MQKSIGYTYMLKVDSVNMSSVFIYCSNLPTYLKEQFYILGNMPLCFLAELDERISTTIMFGTVNLELQPAADELSLAWCKAQSLIHLPSPVKLVLNLIIYQIFVVVVITMKLSGDHRRNLVVDIPSQIIIQSKTTTDLTDTYGREMYQSSHLALGQKVMSNYSLLTDNL